MDGIEIELLDRLARLGIRVSETKDGLTEKSVGPNRVVD